MEESVVLFLVLTVACSVLVSVIIRINEGRDGDRQVVAAANYVMAALLSYAAIRLNGGSIDAGSILAGAGLGIGFVAGFLLMMKGISEIGLAIPTSAARLSMLIPVIGSVIVFDERPTTLKIVGIFVGLLAFMLLGLSQRQSRPLVERPVGPGGAMILILLFMTVGATDFGMKILIAAGVGMDPLAFVIFSSAAIVCWGLVILQRRKIRARDLSLGALLGIPNFLSVLFLLLALGELEASSVFPAVSTGAVVLVNLVAAIFWRERPNRPAAIGLALAVIAVALLS